MVELRKDYFLDRYVAVATDRSKRPSQFKTQDESQDDKKCFFCPGHEHETPEEIIRFPNKDKWEMRVFENKFPAVSSQGNPEIRTDNEIFTFSDAVGKHEIIVETPNHNEQLWDFSVDRTQKLLELYQSRIVELNKLENINYVSVFKNHGDAAGASLRHSHTQIIASNIPPVEIIHKEKLSEDDCPYCNVLDKEKNSLRVVRDDEFMMSFTPYASRFPFEAWIFPKRHVISINQLKKAELKSLAENINNLLTKLKKLNASYNLFLQEGTKNMHFHIVLAPRLAKWAGFEFATGAVINPVSPENAADFYRNS
ncbi:MAG: galactose-1-phosphate uridylyltransferase [Nanobdellota archaeon]